MLFWLFFALMTGAAVFAVLWPLSRSRTQFAPGREADLAVYRDQLAEIDRDRARGLLPEGEAEAARIEVSRRLLAAGEKEDKRVTPGATDRRRIAAVMAVVGIPLLAIGIYNAVGSPGLPDAPLAARFGKSPGQQDIAILMQRVEAHLAQNPDDARGWEILAPIYIRLGRGEDAVKARRHILRLEGSNAAREADLGEALVVASGGIVTTEARAALDRARAHDPKNTKALFFLGLAAEQDGRPTDAVATWHSLIQAAPDGDPWRVAAVRRIERLQAGNAKP